MDGRENSNTKSTRSFSSESVNTHFGKLHTHVANQEKSHEPKSDNEHLASVVDDFLKSLSEDEIYQNIHILGEGGMGTIDKVKDKRCLRNIALKTLHSKKATEEDLVRFTDEAQITAQLEHPNIVPIYDVGIDKNEQLFYTMKMIEGKNLKEIINAIKRGNAKTIEKYPLSRLLEIFAAICDAMAYACSHKVIHRDLKPDNIMIAEFGEVYLVDWGLAKVAHDSIDTAVIEIPKWIINEVNERSDEHTNRAIDELKKVKSMRVDDQKLEISFNDILVGTPPYMAPERISGEADEKSEVYALGAILYNILTLELTVQGENMEEVLTKIIHGDIKHPLSFNKKSPHLPNGTIPPGLASVTMKCLNTNPKLRYPKVSQLRREISKWQDGFLTNAEKAGPWSVMWSLVKRNRKETLTAIGFTFLLISIFTIYE